MLSMGKCFSRALDLKFWLFNLKKNSHRQPLQNYLQTSQKWVFFLQDEEIVYASKICTLQKRKRLIALTHFPWGYWNAMLWFLHLNYFANGLWRNKNIDITIPDFQFMQPPFNLNGLPLSHPVINWKHQLIWTKCIGLEGNSIR